MKRFVVATLGLGFLAFMTSVPAGAADPCPAELTQAQAALKSAQTSLKKSPKIARDQDQAPRSQVGAKAQDIQAPRSQDVQAPKSQDIQAPRSQDIQAPRSQDVQAPRTNQAAALVRQAEAACKKGDRSLSAQKAQEALGLLKK